MKKRTSRSRSGSIIKFSSEDYQKLFESTMDSLIVYDPELNRIIMCNHAASQLFGYSDKDEFMKLSPFDLSAEYQTDGSSTKQRISQVINRVFKENQVSGVWKYVKKDGQNFMCQVNLSRIELESHPVILANFRDITEQLAIQEELRDNIFMLDAAVNGTGVGLWDWDISNDNLVLNDNWFNMLGFSRIDFEKRYRKFGYQTFADSVHPEDMLKVENKLKKHYSGEIDYYRVEIRMMTAGGRWKWILAAGKVCEWKDNKPARMVGIHTDIDYRVQMENKLKEAISKAEESDRLKSAFLANMSHEIRTPMNAIIGFMDLMESKDTSPEQQKEYSDIIRSSARQLLDLVNDIMDISKIEAGQIDVFESVINISNLFDGIIAQYDTVSNQNLKFSIQYDQAGIEEYVLTDSSKLRQILTNLISNAIKFTDRGEISVGCSRKGNMLEFFVSDTGEGIDPSLHEVIFERFRQADSKAAAVKGGTGLGLSICKAYVEKLGGRIWLTSARGRGSIFYFTIPYQPVKDHVMDQSKPKSQKADGNKGLILVVEDELYNFLFAEHVLTSNGYKVLHAETGRASVDFVKKYSEISLVIMDLRLPDISGHEATDMIKKLRPDLPVVALTALALSGDRELALDAGCDEYLKKPITKEKLAETVELTMQKFS